MVMTSPDTYSFSPCLPSFLPTSCGPHLGWVGHCPSTARLSWPLTLSWSGFGSSPAILQLYISTRHLKSSLDLVRSFTFLVYIWPGMVWLIVVSLSLVLGVMSFVITQLPFFDAWCGLVSHYIVIMYRGIPPPMHFYSVSATIQRQINAGGVTHMYGVWYQHVLMGTY